MLGGCRGVSDEVPCGSLLQETLDDIDNRRIERYLIIYIYSRAKLSANGVHTATILIFEGLCYYADEA
jgi:hypothetical protein